MTKIQCRGLVLAIIGIFVEVMSVDIDLARFHSLVLCLVGVVFTLWGCIFIWRD